MRNAKSPDEVYADLRRLTVEDPKRARTSITDLIETNSPFLEALLERAALVGEARLRHSVANAVRGRRDINKFAQILRVWLDVETDEFTRRALVAAMEGADPVVRVSPMRDFVVDPALVASYRYVTTRIQHRLRNVLMGPLASVLRLRRHLSKVTEAKTRDDLGVIVGELERELTRIGYSIEFAKDEAVFRPRPIAILEWLRRFNDDYSRKSGAVTLSIECDQDLSPSVLANDYLLDIIFNNLWINAQQNINGECQVLVSCDVEGPDVRLIISDNGEGFAPGLAASAFFEPLPRSPDHQGRGLLEIQEAIERLHGRCKLVLHRGAYRFLLALPLKHP